MSHGDRRSKVKRWLIDRGTSALSGVLYGACDMYDGDFLRCAHTDVFRAFASLDDALSGVGVGGARLAMKGGLMYNIYVKQYHRLMTALYAEQRLGVDTDAQRRWLGACFGVSDFDTTVVLKGRRYAQAAGDAARDSLAASARSMSENHALVGKIASALRLACQDRHPALRIGSVDLSVNADSPFYTTGRHTDDFNLFRIMLSVRAVVRFEDGETMHIANVPCEVFDVTIPLGRAETNVDRGERARAFAIDVGTVKTIRTLFPLKDAMHDLHRILWIDTRSRCPAEDRKYEKRLARFYTLLHFHALMHPDAEPHAGLDTSSSCRNKAIQQNLLDATRDINAKLAVLFPAVHVPRDGPLLAFLDLAAVGSAAAATRTTRTRAPTTHVQHGQAPPSSRGGPPRGRHDSTRGTRAV